MTRDDSFFEPSDFIRYLRTIHPESAGQTHLPTRAVFAFGPELVDACRKAFHARPTDWNSRFSLGRAGKRPVAVVRSAIGAPASVLDLEESIAMGSRIVLAFGACGSLRGDLPIGITVLPTAAYSDEGTSRHYGGSLWTRPDAALVRRIRSVCRRRSLSLYEGAVWTTDAVYRESRSRARSLVRRGVVGVEMESSALFTIGRVRHARVASILVVSDELAGDSWNPGFEHPAFRAGVRNTLRAVVDVMSGGVP